MITPGDRSVVRLLPLHLMRRSEAGASAGKSNSTDAPFLTAHRSAVVPLRLQTAAEQRGYIPQERGNVPKIRRF